MARNEKSRKNLTEIKIHLKQTRTWSGYDVVIIRAWCPAMILELLLSMHSFFIAFSVKLSKLDPCYFNKFSTFGIQFATASVLHRWRQHNFYVDCIDAALIYVVAVFYILLPDISSWKIPQSPTKVKQQTHCSCMCLLRLKVRFPNMLQLF